MRGVSPSFSTHNTGFFFLSWRGANLSGSGMNVRRVLRGNHAKDARMPGTIDGATASASLRWGSPCRFAFCFAVLPRIPTSPFFHLQWCCPSHTRPFFFSLFRQTSCLGQLLTCLALALVSSRLASLRFDSLRLRSHSRPHQEDDRQEARHLAQVVRQGFLDQASDQVQDPLLALLVHLGPRGLGQGCQASTIASSWIASRGD